ncbi:hypothetical protein ABPG74_010471 [Tetrahymena malaccensis]
MAFGGFRQTDNSLIIDDRRKIILNTRSLSDFQQKIYLRNFFTNYRPDLSSYDYFAFKEKLRVGELFLNEYRKRINNEVRRATILTPTSSLRENMNHKIADQILDLSSPHIRGAHFQAVRSWTDASKIVNYVEEKQAKINKYGLQFPLLKSMMTEEQCASKEEEVYQRLVREMKKPPKQANNSAEESSDE